MLFRKGVYPYEYMDGWEKFNETLLPEKKEFFRCRLYTCKNEDFEIKNLGKYHDLMFLKISEKRL